MYHRKLMERTSGFLEKKETSRTYASDMRYTNRLNCKLGCRSSPKKTFQYTPLANRSDLFSYRYNGPILSLIVKIPCFDRDRSYSQHQGGPKEAFCWMSVAPVFQCWSCYRLLFLFRLSVES